MSRPPRETTARAATIKTARYVHAPIGEEVRAAAGFYVIEEEKRLPFKDREVLVARGLMAVDSSCCGTTGCGFVLVAGFVLNWQATENENGQAVTEVEPLREPGDRDALRRLLLDTEKVQQVNFL